MLENITIPLSGSLTFSGHADFRHKLAGLEKHGTAKVAFDLSALDFMDSTGMGMLLVARDLVTGRGGQVALRNACGEVRRMLDLAKFGSFFTMETGLMEA